MKDTTQLPDGNVFKGTVTPSDVTTKTMVGLTTIRGLLDNVPGNEFISEPDMLAILGRIAGYIGKLSTDLQAYLALPEV